MSETPPPQAYISKVHLKGYKSIKDLEIDFKPGLNIIIGPNGSGKTNFLEFIEEVDDSMYYDDLTNEEFDFKLIKSDGSEFYLNGRFSFYENQYVFKINEKNIENGKNVFERVFIHQGKKGDVSITNVKINDEPSKYPEKHNPILYGIDFIKFENRYVNVLLESLSFNVKVSNENQLYFFSKKGLEDSLYNILQDSIKELTDIDKVRFEMKIKSTDLVDNLNEFTPIKNIRIDNERIIESKSNGHYSFDNVFLQFLVNERWCYWKELSDGTKRLFYIFIKLLENEGDYIFFIEEPELGIHPDQLYDLMDFLQAQAKEKQIIITTHSPEVMNILNKDELDRIIVTRFDKDKGTQMHKLSPHKIKKGQIYMKKVGYLSDFWVHSNLEEYEEQEAE